MELLASLRSAFSPGLSWSVPVKENARLEALAREVAVLAEQAGIKAELRPQIGHYQPALVLEYEDEEKKAGCALTFQWDHSAKTRKRERGSVHLGTLAFITGVAKKATELRGRDYTPVLVSGQRLHGAGARFAHDTGVFFVDTDPASKLAASDVAWALGFNL